MKRDPFELKKRPKWSPSRVSFTIRARVLERYARLLFERFSIPLKEIPVAFIPQYDTRRTAVTPHQMGLLLCAVRHSEDSGAARTTDIVEIGSYLGETTSTLSKFTERTIIAVDPFMGYGGAESDRHEFKKRIADCPNVQHLQLTSGDAAAALNGKQVSLIFIDAVHDYVNVAFDIERWSQKLVPGGLMALHDVDSRGFAGARMAARQALNLFELWAHTPGLLILRKP
jgi:predicted O-methyltransferase YrrM